MNHRVVVTGGLGFVGHALTSLLVRAGADVLVIDDETLGKPENLTADVRDAARFATVDVRDVDRLKREMKKHDPETVFHLAAIHFIPLCDADPRRAIRVNVEGTQGLIEACQILNLQALVIASTAAVYAPADEAHDEASRLGPTDIYGLTKLWDEQLVDMFHRRTSTPTGVVRLFNAAGSGETNPHLIPTVIRQLRQGRDLRLGNLGTERDYVHVADAAEGFVHLAKRLADYPTITTNIGSETAVSGEILVQMIAELMGVEPVIHQDPSRLRTSDRPRLLSDCSQAHDLLGWATRRSLRDALSDAIDRPLANSVSFI